MKLLSKLKIPYSEDKVFGFLLLSLIVVSMVSVTVFSESFDSPRLMIWSVLLGFALIFAIKTKRLSTTFTKPLLILMGLMWFWALLGTTFSLDRINSLVGVSIRMTSSLWFYSLWLVTLYLLGTLGKNKLSVLVKVWFIIGGLMSIWAVLQFFGFGFYEGVNAPVRALVPSFLANPNFSAMYIASTIFVSMWYVTSKNFPNWFRILAFSILGFNIISLVMFASRGAIIGVLGGFAILVLIFLFRKKWKIVFGGVVVALVLASISYLYLNSARDQAVGSVGKDLSAQQRWYLWDDSTTNIIKHPLTGSGLANYFILFRLSDASYFANSEWFDDPHNLFLHITVNGGIIAGLVFVVLLGFTAWNLYSYHKATKDDFPLYMLAALVSLAITACFNPVVIANWFLLALIIALSSQYLPLRDVSITSFARKTGYLISIIFILGGLGFIFSEISLRMSDTYFSSNKSKAIEVNKIAIYFNPTSSAAISSLAKKQFENKEYEQSYQTYQRLEKLHPKSAYITEGALAGYLDLYTDTHDEKYKAEVYRTIPIVLHYFPNNFSTRYNIASFYSRLGDYDKALTQIKTAIVFSNGDYGCWVMMSHIYDELGQAENKKKAILAAYKLNPSDELKKQLQK